MKLRPLTPPLLMPGMAMLLGSSSPTLTEVAGAPPPTPFCCPCAPSLDSPPRCSLLAGQTRRGRKGQRSAVSALFCQNGLRGAPPPRHDTYPAEQGENRQHPCANPGTPADGAMRCHLPGGRRPGQGVKPEQPACHSLGQQQLQHRRIEEADLIVIWWPPLPSNTAAAVLLRPASGAGSSGGQCKRRHDICRQRWHRDGGQVDCVGCRVGRGPQAKAGASVPHPPAVQGSSADSGAQSGGRPCSLQHATPLGPSGSNHPDSRPLRRLAS